MKKRDVSSKKVREVTFPLPLVVCARIYGGCMLPVPRSMHVRAIQYTRHVVIPLEMVKMLQSLCGGEQRLLKQVRHGSLDCRMWCSRPHTHTHTHPTPRTSQ